MSEATEPAGRSARPTGMKLLVMALSVVAIAACAKSAEAPGGGNGGGSGVRGTVLAGPACGGPVILDSPCPDEPVAAEISVTKVGSPEVVATARSGEDGRFSLELEPGAYTLLASATGGASFPIGRPTDVNVQAGLYTEVILDMDTGIR